MSEEDHDLVVGTRAYRARIWTYLLLGVILVVSVVLGNFVLTNPQVARDGIDVLLGLPAWAYPVISGMLGLGLFWLGLTIESDWPEAAGSLIVAGSVAGGEFLLGWKNFELGGLKVIPYVIPFVVFLVMMMIGTKKSR